MTHPHKTWATWIAVLGGSLGLHRFYLHGWRDVVGWLYPLPSLLGLWGVWRMRTFGVDDHLGWFLVPLLGLSLAAAMLSAIVYGLTSDEKWAARWHQALRPTGWGPVLGAIAALFVGAAVLMGTISFVMQKLFEWEAGQLAALPPAIFSIA